MTHRSKKIIFFGNERLVSGLEHTDAPILNGLIDSGYHVLAIVAHHTESKSRKIRTLEVVQVAEQHNIPVYLPSNPSDIKELLEDLKPDAGVLAAYGRIIPQEIIDIFPSGIINIHPSLLPKFRGPTPIESVILSGERVTGTSIMQLTRGMDEGPVYAQRELALYGNEGKEELYKKLVKISLELLLEVLPRILSGSLQPTPQDNASATYGELIKKNDSVIDWKQSIETIERKIRAYQGWPGSRTTLGEVEVLVLKTHTMQTMVPTTGTIEILNKRELRVAAQDGYVYIDTLRPLGKKEMPVQAFLAGYKDKL